MAKYRTIESAYKELKRKDPDTAISKNFIREIVINGIIPYKKAGIKYLFDIEELEKYFKSS